MKLFSEDNRFSAESTCHRDHLPPPQILVVSLFLVIHHTVAIMPKQHSRRNFGRGSLESYSLHEMWPMFTSTGAASSMSANWCAGAAMPQTQLATMAAGPAAMVQPPTQMQQHQPLPLAMGTTPFAVGPASVMQPPLQMMPPQVMSMTLRPPSFPSQASVSLPPGAPAVFPAMPDASAVFQHHHEQALHQQFSVQHQPPYLQPSIPAEPPLQRRPTFSDDARLIPSNCKALGSSWKFSEKRVLSRKFRISLCHCADANFGPLRLIHLPCEAVDWMLFLSSGLSPLTRVSDLNFKLKGQLRDAVFEAGRRRQMRNPDRMAGLSEHLSPRELLLAAMKSGYSFSWLSTTAQQAYMGWKEAGALTDADPASLPPAAPPSKKQPPAIDGPRIAMASEAALRAALQQEPLAAMAASYPAAVPPTLPLGTHVPGAACAGASPSEASCPAGAGDLSRQDPDDSEDEDGLEAPPLDFGSPVQTADQTVVVPAAAPPLAAAGAVEAAAAVSAASGAPSEAPANPPTAVSWSLPPLRPPKRSDATTVLPPGKKRLMAKGPSLAVKPSNGVRLTADAAAETSNAMMLQPGQDALDQQPALRQAMVDAVPGIEKHNLNISDVQAVVEAQQALRKMENAARFG